MIPIRGGLDVLSRTEKETIHRNVLRVLAEVGLQVEHAGMLDAFAEHGFPIDPAKQRVYFPSDKVEEHRAACPTIDWQNRVPGLLVRLDVYASRYLVPGTDRFEAWRPDLFRHYMTLGSRLPEVEGMHMLGCPYRVPARLEPLYERINAWQCGAEPGGSLHPFESADAIWDLVQTYARLKDKQPAEVFTGCCYLMSPLRLSAEECKQIWYWHQKGLPVNIGHMPTAGSTTPVTLAGLVTLTTAEHFALSILRHVLYGTRQLGLFSLMGVSDMRTMIRPMGRPDMPVANAMMASMARFYRVGTFGHSGLTDAKLPTQEAGVQKCMSALATLLYGADAMMAVGLLSQDEICSPVQAILDCEYVRALRHFLREFEVSDESISFETIADVGPGGSFLDTPHTLEHFRDELFESQLWERDMFSAWLGSGANTDVKRATEQCHELMDGTEPVNHLSDEEERELMKVIRAAGG